MDGRSTRRPHRHVSQACQNCRAARAKVGLLPHSPYLPITTKFSSRSRLNSLHFLIQLCREANLNHKCNGTLPCNRCSERREDCAFAQSGDGRSSRLDFRYKVAELQHENWVLRYFVDYLQQSSEQENHQLLVRLRSLSPEYVRRNVDVLYNLTSEVSSHLNQLRLGGSDLLSLWRSPRPQVSILLSVRSVPQTNKITDFTRPN